MRLFMRRILSWSALGECVTSDDSHFEMGTYYCGLASQVLGCGHVSVFDGRYPISYPVVRSPKVRLDVVNGTAPFAIISLDVRENLVKTNSAIFLTEH
jgi:hypothetical protein